MLFPSVRVPEEHVDVPSRGQGLVIDLVDHLFPVDPKDLVPGPHPVEVSRGVPVRFNDPVRHDFLP